MHSSIKMQKRSALKHLDPTQCDTVFNEPFQQIFPGKETFPAHEVNSINASEQKDLQHASGWKRHVSPCTALSSPPPAAGRGTAGDPSARWLSSAPLDPSSLPVDEPEQHRKSVSSVRLLSGAPPASGAFWPNSKQARLLPLIRFHYNNSLGSNTHTQRERDCCEVYASVYWVSDKKPRGKIINRTALNSHMREESLSVKVIICYSSWITICTWLQRDTVETPIGNSFCKFRITLA